jgi:hypothetical protein
MLQRFVYLVVGAVVGSLGAAPRAATSDAFHACGARAPSELSVPFAGIAQQAEGAPAVDELEALRRALSQPGGGEARREREAAVDALARRREPEAHALLAAVVRRGHDADGTAAYVLRALDRAVAQPAGTVFADPKLREIVLRIHMAEIVRLFAVEPPMLAPEAAAPLIPLARRFLARLSFLDRRDRFEEIVSEGGDPALARAALRAAGASRDVALAGFLADRLDDPALAVAARAALAELTFAEQEFHDRATFDAWMAEHREADYLELVERAARRGGQRLAEQRSEAERRFVEQTSKLMRALALAEAPDWSRIGAELSASPSEEGTAVYLGVLRDTLAARLDAGGKLGGTLQDRQELARGLRLRLEGLADQPTSFALHLETLAYLAVRDDAVQRAAVETALGDALTSAEARVRRAGLRGLRSFPSASARVSVVAAAAQSLADEDSETLAAALLCLAAAGWTAPTEEDPGREDWLLLIRDVLRRAELDPRLRERALDLAVLRDGADKLSDAAYAILVGFAGDPAGDVSLRKQALLRLLAFTRETARAETYVQTVVALLDDADVSIRRVAAHQLSAVPEATQARRAEWLRQIVERASARFLDEVDAGVQRELLDAMLSIADQPEVGAQVLSQLVATGEALAARNSSDDAGRRDLVVEGLRILGVSRARDTKAWLGAARALVGLANRDAVRAVLDRRVVAQESDVEDLPEEERAEAVVAALKLRIAAGRLRSPSQKWTESPEEADAVRAAFERLDAVGAPSQGPGDSALRVQVLSALGRPSEVVDFANRVLSDEGGALSVEERVAVLRGVILAQLELATFDAAEKRLFEFEGLSMSPAAVLDLTFRLAQKRLAAGQAALAVPLADKVLSATVETDPSWADRFLLWAEARWAADPEAERAGLREELARRAERFVGESADAARRARFEQLKAAVDGV